MTLVVGVDAVARVGEPDRSIRVLYNIVGTVQPATVVFGCQHRDRAIVSGSGHPALAVLTGHESALPVDRTTVRKAGWGEEDVGALAHLVITKYPIIGDVAEQHESASRVIPRSLQPATTGEESGDRTIASRTCEAGI